MEAVDLGTASSLGLRVEGKLGSRRYEAPSSLESEPADLPSYHAQCSML